MTSSVFHSSSCVIFLTDSTEQWITQIDWEESQLQPGRICVKRGVNADLDDLRRTYAALPDLLVSSLFGCLLFVRARSAHSIISPFCSSYFRCSQTSQEKSARPSLENSRSIFQSCISRNWVISMSSPGFLTTDSLKMFLMVGPSR